MIRSALAEAVGEATRFPAPVADAVPIVEGSRLPITGALASQIVEVTWFSAGELGLSFATASSSASQWTVSQSNRAEVFTGDCLIRAQRPGLAQPLHVGAGTPATEVSDVLRSKDSHIGAPPTIQCALIASSNRPPSTTIRLND